MLKNITWIRSVIDNNNVAVVKCRFHYVGCYYLRDDYVLSLLKVTD